MATFKIIKPDDEFIVQNSGTQITDTAVCAHGQAAALLVLFGYNHSQRGHTRRLDALMPRCVLAELLGSVQAQILRHEGEDALQQFRAEIDAHTQTSARDLEELHTQRRDCCEAGFRTNGTEHTCGRNPQEGPTP